MTDPPPESPPSVEAWSGLVDALRDAGATVAGLTGTPGVADVDVAEGFRYLLHVLGDQLDRAALRDSAHPLFLPGVTPVRKLLFDNPDTDYDTAAIAGARTYRITGTRGTVPYLAFCVYSGDAWSGGSTRVTNLSDDAMTFGPGGSIDLTLSPGDPPPGHAGDWIRLEPDAHTVIARQYHLDRPAETAARYLIEAVGHGPAALPPDPPLDSTRFASLARRTARFVVGAATLARRRAEAAAARPNRFVAVPGHGVFGTPDAGYVACWYDLAPGEALVVEARPPRCRYWGVHLANRWGQSLDHRTRPTVLNARTAATRPDGSVQVIVAPTDPGGRSWLDTAGHPRGWVLFRWLLADRATVPDARVVRLDDLEPAGR